MNRTHWRTAVPGLAAKPVLDLMVGVKHLSEAERLIEPLSDLGYEYVFHEAFPLRRFLEKANGGPALIICISMFIKARSGKTS